MGSIGRREAGRKRASGSPASRLQTDRQPPRLLKCHRQPPTQNSLPDIPLNHVDTLPLGISFCLPPPPEELAPRRGVSAAYVCQRPSPWVLLHRYLGPCYGMNTALDAREPGRSGQEQPPHSHTLGSELAWFLPSCRMTSRLEGDTQCLSIPGVGGRGRCWDP